MKVYELDHNVVVKGKAIPLLHAGDKGRVAIAPTNF
jgi:hypothetical protein